MTRACVILSNGYSRVASATFVGTGVGNLPSMGHTVFGDLNRGLLASTMGPFVRIDVGSNRLFELVLGFIAATAVAVIIPLDADGPSTMLLLVMNGAIGIATDVDDAAAIATFATTDCCC